MLSPTVLGLWALSSRILVENQQHWTVAMYSASNVVLVTESVAVDAIRCSRPTAHTFQCEVARRVALLLLPKLYRCAHLFVVG